jgi:hypothetical protein
MLTPIGRLLPLMLVIIPPISIPMLLTRMLAIPAVSIATRLLPLAVLVIPAVGMAAGLLPLALMAIPAIVIAAIPAVVIALRLMPLTLMAVPTEGLAVGLLPLTVLAMPAIGLAARLLPAMRLTRHPVNMGPRLGRGESRTMRLPGKGAIRSGLGAHWDQSHKQARRENNAPPSFRSHFIILLNKILRSGFAVNSECRPREKVSAIFKIGLCT